MHLRHVHVSIRIPNVMNVRVLLCCMILFVPLAGCIDPADASGSDGSTSMDSSELFYIHGDGTYTCNAGATTNANGSTSHTYCDDDTAEGLQNARNVITSIDQEEGTAIQVHAQTRFAGSDGFLVETTCTDGGQSGIVGSTGSVYGMGDYLAFAGEECTHTFVIYIWHTAYEYTGHWNIVYSVTPVTEG